jgi:hypothetical protein
MIRVTALSAPDNNMAIAQVVIRCTIMVSHWLGAPRGRGSWRGVDSR